ncbi:MAG: PBS lyase, partial [Deltaproteobacteria bacterium]|nr:PBS lyase [Deltaproteobacteria bacterium]
MVGRFKGREIVDKPSCPFCGAFIERPVELALRMPTEMPLGRCACGAVYACDVTGHSLGTAMIEALVFACGGDWDLAWGLLPEEDYLEKQMGQYDYETHLIIHGGIYGGRRIAGKLFFIRLHQDVREVTDQDTRRLIEKSISDSDG